MAKVAGKSKGKTTGKGKGNGGGSFGSFIVRWTKRFIFLSGMVFLLGLASAYFTSQALIGQWQPQEPELSDQSLEIISDAVRNQMQGGGAGESAGAAKAGRPPLLNPSARMGLARLGVRIAGKMASGVTVKLTSTGYAFEGDVLSLTLVSALYQGGPGSDVQGCLKGSYTAVFPILRVSCGDGSGRELHFLMKSWPGSELRLLPIPLGNDAVSQRIRNFNRNRSFSTDQLKALDELMTLRLKRG